MNNLLDAALDYAARGWPAFPLQPRTKEPATKRGFYDATTNPATLQRWFARFYYNIGIRTARRPGCSSWTSTARRGANNLRALEAEHGPLPATLTSTTGKGRHLWFRAAGEIPCSTGRIAAGIDVRADGGYAVAPPSVHPNGTVYAWVDYSIPPAAAPDWLIRLAQRPLRVATPAPCGADQFRECQHQRPLWPRCARARDRGTGSGREGRPQPCPQPRIVLPAPACGGWRTKRRRGAATPARRRPGKRLDDRSRGRAAQDARHHQLGRQGGHEFPAEPDGRR